MNIQNAGGVDALTVLRQMFAVCANERRMQEADALDKAIAALSAVSPDAATVDDALSLAIKFHDTYERLAPSFGYETRQETREFDPTTPNGRLMVAVCGAMLRDMQAARVPDGGKCKTCNGIGLVGGHGGQTPESYEEVTEACPDCLPDGAGGKAVAWQYRFKYGENDVGEWTELRAQDASLRDLPHVETRALYAHPPTAEPSLSREGASVSNAVRGPLKLDTDSQVFFYEQDFYVLSNFSSFALEWKGLRFDTSEAAYHWEKFPDAPEVQRAILMAPSAHEAFKLAERHRAARRPDWDEIKVAVMREILTAKAAQHEYVRRKLLDTGSRELVENSWRDDYWGWGPNRDGQNMLGKLWMEVRSAIATPSPTTLAATAESVDGLVDQANGEKSK